MSLPRCRMWPNGVILSEMKEIEQLGSLLEGFAEVRLAYLFGSVASGTERTASDIDIAILLQSPNDLETQEKISAAIERAFGRTVDLVDLAHAPPLLAHEIIRAGKLILCRDEDEQVRFVTRTAARYLDTAHLRRVQHEYLRDRVEALRGTPG